MNAIDKIMGRKTEENIDENKASDVAVDSDVNAQPGSETGTIVDSPIVGESNPEEHPPEDTADKCVECDSTDLTHRKSGLIICNSCKHINRSALDEESV